MDLSVAERLSDARNMHTIASPLQIITVHRGKRKNPIIGRDPKMRERIFRKAETPQAFSSQGPLGAYRGARLQLEGESVVP